jgi:hypothetical protein
MTQEMKGAATEELTIEAPKEHAAALAMSRASSVITRMSFAAPPARVWEGLVFYEEIKERPPLHLRLLLPVPVRTEGQISDVGEQAKCVYERGHLTKRVTNIQRGKLYQFEVAEQHLSVGGGMRLCGGAYELRELPDGRTEVAVETRYVSTKWPRWLWAPLERIVCHAFHRYLLRALRRKVESG